MHVRVSRTALAKRSEEILELGAGSLNDLPWEKDFSVYDIVEPFHKLFENSSNLRLICHAYDQLSAIPPEVQYDRIVSIAVSEEHMLDLPQEIALAGVHLRDGGTFCAGIPSEGGWLWEMAWRYGTGMAFRRRTGLDYTPMMHYEHVGTPADEIETCIRYFFRDVVITRFPLPARSLSLYTFLRATGTDKERCARFLECRLERRGAGNSEGGRCVVSSDDCPNDMPTLLMPCVLLMLFFEFTHVNFVVAIVIMETILVATTCH